nr:adhesion G-protein coupled receptor G4 [Nothobranchius furzeri]XP_054595207.1 adhesion G-protein coupled receptor G4 [Nothobranchius furzeri]
MNSMRRLLFLTCLLIVVSACPLVSAASVSSSLWGKTLQFTSSPCLWQLHPRVHVPALRELTVCMRLKRSHATKWTGFDYKGPQGQQSELGLGGVSKLTVWLFGKRHETDKEVTLNEWHSICLTWSGSAQRLKVYINGTLLQEYPGSGGRTQLSPKGTLTLGVGHFVSHTEVKPETGSNLLGEIGLFRMWSREWRSEELSGLSCADGDVMSWDLQQWKHNCLPPSDNHLLCEWSSYKIKMWAFIRDASNSGSCLATSEVENFMRKWLENIFPTNISVQDVSVSSPRPNCPATEDPAALNEQQPQDLEQLSKLTCDKCFSCEVHVNVDPAADVNLVQTKVTALLTSNFSHGFPTITTVAGSIVVLPVEVFPAASQAPATISTHLFSSEMSSTQSVPFRPANLSTTGEPVEPTAATVTADRFFRVNAIISMSEKPPKPNDVIARWLKEQLEVNKTMDVLNLVIKENADRSVGYYSRFMTFYSQQKQYNCTFHVKEFCLSCAEGAESLILAALTEKFDNGSFIIQTVKVTIKPIEPQNCLEDDTSTIYGRYIWPETFPEETQEMGCKKPVSNRAYRHCKLDIETDTTSWADPNMTKCEQLLTISDLNNITVTPGNAAEVVDMIQDLVEVQLGDSSQLSSSELGSVVEKLSEVLDVSTIEPDVGGDIVNIVANILLSETDVTPVASTVLDLTDRMGNSMEFQGESTDIKAPALALSMINVDRDEFSGLTFAVSLSPNMDPEIFVNQSFVSKPLPQTDATISLPFEVNNFFPPGVRNTTRVQFQFYGTPDLFQDPLLANVTQRNWTLNSFVVSASINNSQVINLVKPVVVTLSHQTPKKLQQKVQCMFWDFQKYGGLGGWNSSGCETRSVSSHQTSCLCDHLTHFAVLLDVSRSPVSGPDSEILTVISYVGCGISSVFLGITLLTYIFFEKLRQDYPSKILMNLSVALLGLSMLFLLDSWLSSFNNYGLCITTAAALHYFMLASFTWMGLEAVHMYFALVKVFNTYIPSYILKFCAVGWGIPLVTVSMVLAVDKDAYGSLIPKETAVALQSAEPFCWLQDDVFFFMTVAFVLLILLGNVIVFIVVLIQIKQMRANKLSANSRSSLQDLKAVVGLTVLLGLTWSMGFFSFGPGRVAMMYLFSICNSLQGFFVFLFHCLMKENVRKQWRINLCCGRFSDNSDWSRSVTVCGRSDKGNLINSDSVTSENTSSLRSLTPPHSRTTRGQE